MYKNQYWMAGDCPNCGEKDAENAWRGARIVSSEWGHDYACCSDKCGREFANSKKRKELGKADLRQKIAALTDQLHGL